MDNTFIKLNRKIIEWEWYKKPNTYRLFIHCLLKANWKDGKFQGQEITRGSFVTSIDKLSLELGLTIQQIRTSISHLISTSNITSRSFSKYRIITVLSYEDYQDSNKQINKLSTGNQQATNKQLTTIEEKKEVKNRKNKDLKEYGELSNVLLDDEEFEKLKEKNLLSYIEDLSLYIPNKKGKPYANHYATILQWSRKDEKQKTLQTDSKKELPSWYEDQSEIDTGMEDFDEFELQEKIKRLRGEEGIKQDE